VSGPIQTFSSAMRLMGAARARPYVCMVASTTGGLVTTAPGLAIMTQSLAALARQPIDTLIVPGGSPKGEPVVAPELVAWIAARAGGTRRVASVCTGAFMLAATGLLDRKRATTHWNWAELLQKLHPKVRVDPDPIYIKEGKVWT